MKGFETFAEAETAAGLINNVMYAVGGKDTLLDGFEGLFVFKKTSTVAAGDDVIAVGSGGRLHRMSAPVPRVVVDPSLAGPIGVAVDVALRATPLTVGSGWTDSAGAALPAGFDNFAEAIDETDPNAVTITRTRGADSWVQTITIVGAVTTVSQWVKQ